MNYCVYLKKRKNKPFCKLINEEIAFSQCRKCDKKEYYFPDARKMGSKRHQLKKYKKELVTNCHQFKKCSESAVYCRALQSNNHQIKKSPLLKEKSPVKSKMMKNKSNKLAKLERNRFSVFTDNKEKCMFCPSTTNLTWHEIFAGRNRRNSMSDGFCLRMCLYCHEKKQEDTYFNDFWHREAQLYFEKHIGSREDFLSKYRKNYLD